MAWSCVNCFLGSKNSPWNCGPRVLCYWGARWVIGTGGKCDPTGPLRSSSARATSSWRSELCCRAPLDSRRWGIRTLLATKIALHEADGPRCRLITRKVRIYSEADLSYFLTVVAESGPKSLILMGFRRACSFMHLVLKSRCFLNELKKIIIDFFCRVKEIKVYQVGHICALFCAQVHCSAGLESNHVKGKHSASGLSEEEVWIKKCNRLWCFREENGVHCCLYYYCWYYLRNNTDFRRFEKRIETRCQLVNLASAEMYAFVIAC